MNTEYTQRLSEYGIVFQYKVANSLLKNCQDECNQSSQRVHYANVRQRPCQEGCGQGSSPRDVE